MIMSFMYYYDNLNSEIKEYFKILCPSGIPKFLISFIESKTLMRLSKISYFCGMEYGSKDIYDFKYFYSRLDHSIAVALIVWNHTFDVNETLAALFHDASTPAFSHVIDYMNKDYLEEESTELDLKDFLQNDTELIREFKNKGLKIEDIATFKDYPLVDNDRPKLCADRLECLFSANLIWTKTIALDEIKDIYDDITITHNEYDEEEYNFTSIVIADRAVELNDIINKKTHTDEDYTSMNLLAAMTKKLIDLEIISYDDLYTLDDEVVMKLIYRVCFIDKEMKCLYKLFSKLLYANIKDKPEIKNKNINPLVKNIRYANY